MNHAIARPPAAPQDSHPIPRQPSIAANHPPSARTGENRFGSGPWRPAPRHVLTGRRPWWTRLLRSSGSPVPHRASPPCGYRLGAHRALSSHRPSGSSPPRFRAAPNPQVTAKRGTRGDAAGGRPLVSIRAQVERGDGEARVVGCSSLMELTGRDSRAHGTSPRHKMIRRSSSVFPRRRCICTAPRSTHCRSPRTRSSTSARMSYWRACANCVSALADAASTNRPSSAVIVELSNVRRRYDSLMEHAAAAPGSSLGQQLYVTRLHAKLSAEEVANGAGLPTHRPDELEAGDAPNDDEASKDQGHDRRARWGAGHRAPAVPRARARAPRARSTTTTTSHNVNGHEEQFAEENAG